MNLKFLVACAKIALPAAPALALRLRMDAGGEAPTGPGRDGAAEEDAAAARGEAADQAPEAESQTY